ncbi:MAG: endonuclease/exonuclease/phosphatase family protein [Deltaproteobacteria bacterium]|nr:endonuclease/exonuclease/phosphatase family protein [Deltaproteobacteria bacterium]
MTARKKKKAKKKAARAATRAQRSASAQGPQHLDTPHLCLLRAPARSVKPRPMRREISVATYNVHRWTVINGRSASDPARAAFVISEMAADVIALQEVMRPHGGDDPLEALAEALGMHVTFAATRVHKRGELGNAILSRWPIGGVSMLDLSYSRLEKRVAVAAQIPFDHGVLEVVATHLALADRTRHKQVRALLEHPQLGRGPTVLLGDMNAWRRCRATRALDSERWMTAGIEFPMSFPAARPVLALDRIYTSGVDLVDISAYDSRAAQRASDHLPVVARIRLPD